LHHVSAVKYRNGLILPSFEIELYKYISGITEGLNQTLIQINGMQDHIHILVRLRPDMKPSEYVQKVKANSSKWINESGFLNTKFEWQTGGGSFSVSYGHVERVKNYVANQKEHHRHMKFKPEYKGLLEENGIDSKDEFLPIFFDDL
jgi:putative transposase